MRKSRFFAVCTAASVVACFIVGALSFYISCIVFFALAGIFAACWIVSDFAEYQRTTKQANDERLSKQIQTLRPNN